MQKMIHGGDITSAREQYSGEILDFSANINPLGLPDNVKEALEQHCDEFAAYPDPLCRKLTARLAEKEGVPPDYILFGNGSADLIFRLVWAIRPRRALVVDPTFAEYGLALESAGCHISHYQLNAEQDFLLTDDILEQIQPSTNILFLCNPNNPTGKVIEPELLCRILVRCLSCGTLLVLDECFIDFLENSETFSMKPWLVKFPNLFLLKAFTKTYAMAGLRLGYCLCGNRYLLQRLCSCGQPWSVSAPAQIAGLAALDEDEYVAKAKALILEEKTFLKGALEKLNMTVIGSGANFIFFRSSAETSVPLDELMAKEGILIRNCSNFTGLDNSYFRIAVRTHQENERLIRIMTRVLKRTKDVPLVKEKAAGHTGEKDESGKAPKKNAQQEASASAVQTVDKGRELFSERKKGNQENGKQKKLYRLVSRKQGK